MEVVISRAVMYGHLASFARLVGARSEYLGHEVLERESSPQQDTHFAVLPVDLILRLECGCTAYDGCSRASAGLAEVLPHILLTSFLAVTRHVERNTPLSLRRSQDGVLCNVCSARHRLVGDKRLTRTGRRSIVL